MKNFIEVGQTADEQEQQIKNWIKENGPQIIAGVVIGISAIWGMKAYDDYNYTQAVEARTHYLNYSTNPSNEAPYNELKANFPDSSYTDEAALVSAKHAVTKGDFAKALEYLTPVSSSENIAISNTAKLRIASIHLENKDFDKAFDVLNTNSNSAFAGLFNNLKGDVYVAQGNIKLAKEHYVLAKAQISADSKLQNLIQIKLNDLN